MADSCEGRLLFDVQRGRLGRRGRQLATAAAARVLALPRTVAPLPPVAIPVATCVDPNCILNDFEIPSAVQLFSGVPKNHACDDGPRVSVIAATRF